MVNPDHLNVHVKRAEYAVRGAILLESEKIQREMNQDPSKYPFKKLIPCNIGNPQELLQKPIQYNRQVLSLVDCPDLIDKVGDSVPSDVVARAKDIVEAIGHPNRTGAYTNSKGYAFVREAVAQYIQERDGGVPASADDIFLTDGASPAVKAALQCFSGDPKVAFMIPLPQYPLYTATLAMLQMQAAPYYLNEENRWSLELSELERSYQEALREGKEVRGLCVINPGNPTGGVLSEKQILDVCLFAKKYNLLVLADEVYQANVYKVNPATGEREKFVSFKKVVGSYPELKGQPLISFHSTSKGITGECGRRGGYMECVNVHQDMMDMLLKLASVSLCSNVGGQLMMKLMLQGPKPGDASYDSWRRDCDGIFESMARRATMLVDGLNKIPGIRSQPIDGAMYAFASLDLPPGAIEAARARGMAPDAMWCMDLLRATGIIIVPGSGFGQRTGSFHFRTTILPPEDSMAEVVELISKFQRDFLAKYGGGKARL